MTEIESALTGDDRRSDVEGPGSVARDSLQPPKLLAWLASAVTLALIVVAQTLPRGSNSYLRGAGVVSLLLAGEFILIPFALLARHGRTQEGGTYMQTRAVVDRGLYAAVRHPQTLSYMLLGAGFALLSQHWVAALLSAMSVTLFGLQAVREERYTCGRLGEPYARYCRRVPRFNVVLGLIRLLRARQVRKRRPQGGAR